VKNRQEKAVVEEIEETAAVEIETSVEQEDQQNAREEVSSQEIEAKAETEEASKEQEEEQEEEQEKQDEEVAHDSKPSIVGIDLGTTHSCVAYVDKGVAKIIPSAKGYSTTPSMVALNDRNKVVVGHVAADQIVTNPHRTIYGSKRLIGRPFNSPAIQQMKHYFTYQVVEGENHQASVKLGDQVLSLPQISAHILEELIDVAQVSLDTEIKDVVISVPAYYNDNQRSAVKKAGELAGLNVIRLVNEPTAAALAYGFNRKLNKRILIFDLGGGTFDGFSPNSLLTTTILSINFFPSSSISVNSTPIPGVSSELAFLTQTTLP